MSVKANATDISGYKPLADPEFIEKFSYNQKQRAGKLVREITHKHNYGVAIMAQQTKKVAELQAALQDLGFPPVEFEEPDFKDPAKLEEYIKLSAYQG